MEEEGLNEAVSDLRRRTATLLIVAVFSCLTLLYADVDIRFASELDAVNQQSDGSAMDTSFTFQLGTFEDGWMPTSSNTDQWLDNWVEAPNSAPTGGPTVQYSQTPLPFAVKTGASNRFSGTTRLSGNPTDFTSLDQAYIWGYTDRGEGGGGTGEWILLTNTAWTFPTDTGGVQFGSDFLVSDAGTIAVLGSVNPEFSELGDDPHMVSDSVLLPVPEPSVSLLLLGGAGMLLRRRR